MYTVISGFGNSFLLRKESFIVLALVSSLKHLKLFPHCLELSAKLGFSQVSRKAGHTTCIPGNEADRGGQERARGEQQIVLRAVLLEFSSVGLLQH